MRHLKINAFIALCLLLAGLPTIAAADTAPLTVTDYAGRTVTLTAPARRIAALAPHIVENLYSVGLGKRIVAATEYSDFPEAAQRLPRVGNFMNINREALLAQQPDLVVIWASNRDWEQVRHFTDIGLTVYVDAPQSLDDIPRSLHDLAILGGTLPQAQTAIDDYRQRLAQLRESHRQRPSLSVFYLVWPDPLQTVNGEHMISDIIRLCGGRNVFADATGLAPVISREALLVRNPDVIIGSGTPQDPDGWQTRWRSQTGLSAVRRGHLFSVPPDWLQRHTLRLLLGAERLCERLDEARQPLSPSADSLPDNRRSP